jgi:hypothetical protein
MVVRLINQQKGLVVSDAFLLLSALFALALAICDTITYQLGGLSGVEIDDPAKLIKLGKARKSLLSL